MVFFHPIITERTLKNMPSPLCNVREVFAANLYFIYKRIFLLKKKKQNKKTVIGLNRESEYFVIVIMTGY